MHTTLPRQYYTDPQFYRTELDRFYFQRWICAGRIDQVTAPGDFFVRTIGDESLVITRDAGGGVRALFNVCRHRGTRICEQPEGHFVERIQCPYHAWTYDLSGKLLAAPHMAPDFRREDYPLHRAGCEIWDGHIFVRMDVPAAGGGVAGRADEPRLADQLGDLPSRFANWRMGELQRARRIVYDVKANWKLIVLNFNECLHCPTLHPALNRLHHYLGADNVAPTATYCGGAMGFKGR